jgi:hypothetical protein
MHAVCCKIQLVIHIGQVQVLRITANSQAEQDYLYHWEYNDEEHHPTGTRKCGLHVCSVWSAYNKDMATSFIQGLQIIMP